MCITFLFQSRLEVTPLTSFVGSIDVPKRGCYGVLSNFSTSSNLGFKSRARSGNWFSVKLPHGATSWEQFVVAGLFEVICWLIIKGKKKKKKETLHKTSMRKSIMFTFCKKNIHGTYYIDYVCMLMFSNCTDFWLKEWSCFFFFFFFFSAVVFPETGKVFLANTTNRELPIGVVHVSKKKI